MERKEKIVKKDVKDFLEIIKSTYYVINFNINEMLRLKIS